MEEIKEEITEVKPIKTKQKRKGYFEFMKKLMKIKYKQPKFIYLGEEFENSAVILSNHEGTSAPMSLEIYLPKPVRFWGAHEMNSGLVKLYKYQSRVYYHEKKHWNLFLARLFCLIASPLTNLFYSGLELISTYKDARFVKTIRETIDALNDGDNIVIFPEVSDKGYLPELEGFHSGFVVLGDQCLKKGIDIPVYVAYYKKDINVYVIDAPVKYSQLKEKYKTREEISHQLCLRCNELGKMDLTEYRVVVEQPKSKKVNKEKTRKKKQ